MAPRISEFDWNLDHAIETCRSEAVADCFENPVLVVTKHTAERRRMYFEVDVATAPTQVDNEIKTNVICDTGRAYIVRCVKVLFKNNAYA